MSKIVMVILIYHVEEQDRRKNISRTGITGIIFELT
jgi:hypothetical protein